MQYNERELKEVLRGRPLTHLRIGATKTIGEFVLAEALAHYLSAEDRLLDFTVDNTRRLLEMLEDNRLDFALVEGYFNKAHYGCRLFREEPFVGICAPGHPFAGRAVALEETFGETLILREEGSGTRAIFEQLLRARSFSAGHFRRVVHISNFAMIQKLVAAGTGISFVYAAVAANSVPLATFTLTGMAVTSEFNYVFLKDTRAFEKIDLFERLSLISS